MSNFSVSNFKPEWISVPGKFDQETIDFAEAFGTNLCDLINGRPGKNALTTSQIRNYFGEIRRIQAKIQQGNFAQQKTSFLLVRPKLAYAEARVTAKLRKSRIEEFRKVMDMAHSAVLDSDDKDKAFQYFVDFLEATLAFHKAAGGKD